VIDDLRKLLQDLVTPEMRALAVEVKAQGEKHSAEIKAQSEKFSAEMRALREAIAAQFKAQDEKHSAEIKAQSELHSAEIRALREAIAAEFRGLRGDMDRRFDYIERAFNVDERLAKLEDRVYPPKQKSQ
jgi:hypothetical protein